MDYAFKRYASKGYAFKNDRETSEQPLRCDSVVATLTADGRTAVGPTGGS
jgi:hypothetical protein